MTAYGLSSALETSDLPGRRPQSRWRPVRGYQLTRVCTREREMGWDSVWGGVCMCVLQQPWCISVTWCLSSPVSLNLETDREQCRLQRHKSATNEAAGLHHWICLILDGSASSSHDVRDHLHLPAEHHRSLSQRLPLMFLIWFDLVSCHKECGFHT